MAQLFNRDLSLTVGALRISTRDPTAGVLNLAPVLRSTFKIVRSTDRFADTAEMEIFNLSRANRAALQQKVLPVVLEAGYVGATHQIFHGDVHFVQSVQDGTDWITKFQMGDGLQKMKSARVSASFSGPVTIQQIVSTVVGATGLLPGNTPQAASSRPSLTQWIKGLVLSGKATEELDKVAKAMGKKWFVQNGAVHMLGKNPDGSLETIAGQVIVLSPTSGLIGSPQAGDLGIVKVRSLLQPDLLPGYAVSVASLAVNGIFRIEKTCFTGDTHGQEWYADLELSPVRGI